MTAAVRTKIEELTKKAKQGGAKASLYKLSFTSSLHRIIKTPAQAKRFMRLFKVAQDAVAQ